MILHLMYIFQGLMVQKMNASLLLCIMVVVGLRSCLDFHLLKVVNVPTNKNLTNLVSIDNHTVGAIEGNLSNCTASVLDEDQLEVQVFRTSETDLVSQPKFNGRMSVVLNKGYFMYNRNYGNYRQFNNLNISGKAVSIQANTYFAQSLKCPTLVSFNGLFNNLRAYSFGIESECNSYSPGFISFYTDRYLVFAVKYSVLILDRSNSFQVLASFTQDSEQQTAENVYNGAQTYYNANTLQLTILVRLASLNHYRLMHRSGEGIVLVGTYPLYNPTSQLFLTGLDTGISFHRDYAYRWHKLEGVTVSQDISSVTQSLKQTLPLAITYEEDIFLQKQGNKILIYKLPLDGSFLISKINEVTVPNISSIVEGRVVQNNSYFIFNALTNNNYTTLCRMNVTDLSGECLNELRGWQTPTVQMPAPHSKQGTKQNEEKGGPHVNRNQYDEVSRYGTRVSVSADGFLAITPQQQAQYDLRGNWPEDDAHHYNCVQWAIFSGSNRIVALCSNMTSKLYQLHSYSISTMKLELAENIYLGDVPAPEAVKLVKNEYKQENDQSISDRPMFLIQFKVNSKVGPDEAVTFRYIFDREFIRQNPPSYDISYYNVYAYGNFIASMKIKNSTTIINALRIHDFTSLKVIKDVPYEQAFAANKYYFTGYRNIFIVNENFGLRAAHIYDLKKFPNQVNWFRGTFLYQYFESEPHLSLIFPKRGFQYFYRFGDVITQPYKLIYDITKPPVEQITKMDPLNDVQSAQLHTYLKVQPLIIGRQCEIVYYISESRWLNKYEDCVTERNFFRTDLNPLNKPGTFQFNIISQSDSKQNIVVEYTHTIHSKKYSIIEIRSIENPTKLIWSSNKTEEGPIKFVHYVQTIFGTSYTVGYPTYMRYTDIEQVNNCSYYNLLGFVDMDFKQNCFTFAGKLQQGGGEDTAIYYFKQGLNMFSKSSASSKPLEQLGLGGILVSKDTVSNIILSEDCSKLAAVTGKGFVGVWNITDQYTGVRLKNITKTSDADIRFSSNQKLVISGKGEIDIIDLTVTQNQQQQLLSTVDYSQKLATSKDGQLYAVSSGPLTVHINTIQKQQIRTFKIPQDQTTKNDYIVGLSFSDNNTLYVSVSNSVMYVLSPTPCPEPFVNSNGLCVCQQNQTKVGNTCICNKHFTLSNNSCICDPREFVFEKGQCQCSVNSSEVQGVCKCLQNFVKKDAYCICPTSFQFDNSKLTCGCANGYVEKEECIGCSFPCQTCTSSSSCESYSTLFFVIVICGPLLLLAIIGAVVFCVIRKKKQGHELLKDQLEKD